MVLVLVFVDSVLYMVFVIICVVFMMFLLFDFFGSKWFFFNGCGVILS